MRSPRYPGPGGACQRLANATLVAASTNAAASDGMSGLSDSHAVHRALAVA